MKEHVGYSELDKQYNAELFFFSFSLYMYHSYIFSFKRKHNCDNRQRTKRMQQKNIQKCGGQFAPNSVWLGPSNKTKYFFFSSFTEEQESLLFVFMDVQILTK